MDIVSYPEFKENILYGKDENSEEYNRYIVTSVDEFYKLVLKHKEIIKNKDEEDLEEIVIKSTYYRGQSNKEWKIDCSLFRNSLIEKEDQLLHEVLNRRPLDFTNCRSNLEKLVLMQHYGIPTRLIDITVNPLVALYFACNDKGQEKSDGAVYIFEENNDIDLNAKEIVASFSFLKDNGTLDGFRKILEKDKAIYEENTIETILNKKYLLINPKLNNDRIIAQQGLFLCCSNTSTEGLLEKNSQIKKKAFSIESSRKIIISKEHKKSILKELEFLGIKKSVLFPELENHAEELIGKFSIKPKISKSKVSKKKIPILAYEIVEKKCKEDDKFKLISEIRNNLSGGIREEILKSISDEDFYIFDSKISNVKKLIKRAKEIDKNIKEKLTKLIDEEKEKYDAS